MQNSHLGKQIELCEVVLEYIEKQEKPIEQLRETPIRMRGSEALNATSTRPTELREVSHEVRLAFRAVRAGALPHRKRVGRFVVGSAAGLALEEKHRKTG